MDGYDFPLETPISRTRPFAAAYHIVVFLSALGLFSVAVVSSRFMAFWDPVAWGAAGIVTIFMWIFYRLILKRELSELELLVGVAMSYFLTTFVLRVLIYLCGDQPTAGFFAFAGTQSALLAGVFWVFENPIHPDIDIHSPNEPQREFLKTHLTNWWRIGQFFLTFGLLVVVTLILNIVPHLSNQFGLSILAVLASPFGIQIAAILVYIRAKMKYVEEKMRP